MRGKIDTASAALAFTILLFAASSAFAQTDGPRLGTAVRVPIEVRTAPATLGCCKCLGGTNSLDLSTISSNRWTVNNGNAVAFLTVTHPAWNINPGPAQWVSTTAGGGMSGIPAGTYEYRLDFFVPECTIKQDVTLTGNVSGDDTFDAFLDSSTGAANTSNPLYLAGCSAGWCFNKPKQSLQTFTRNVGPGPHALIVRINNSGGPSGMFVNATLTGACRRD
jgi:hypothetical protein